MTSAEQRQLRILSVHFFTSNFIVMGGIFKNKQVNLSLQYGTTLLEPVQMLILIQVAKSCKAPKDEP